MRKPERLRDNSPRHSFAGQPNSQGLPRHTRLVLELIVKGELDFAQPFRLPRVDPPIPRALPWAVALGREPDSVAGLGRALQESSATHRSSV